MTGHLRDRADYVAAKESVPAAIETLLEHHLLMPDVLEEDNGYCLSWLLRAWALRGPDDPIWRAATQLFCSVMPGNEFDAGLVKAVIELLNATSQAAVDVDEFEARLPLATYERLRRAHDRIGDVLEAVRCDEVARWTA